jgi:hypothetical protein
MNIKILFSDDLHFHKRGFKSLFEFVKKYKIKHHFIKHTDKNFLEKYGNYKSIKSSFLDYYTLLEELNSDELFLFKYKGINLFVLSKAEILTYTMTIEHWYSREINSNNQFIFDKLYNEDKETLILNMSIAMYWIDFWLDTLKNMEKFTHVCIFSGSLIYQKSLIEISKNTPMKVMIFEHFFTGNDYYCEHKYDHIANNSDIKFSNYYNKVLDIKDMDNITLENEKIKAVNKIINAKNKNVKQPEATDEVLFDNNKKTILILGQVINDFSIIETRLNNICSLSFYKEFISKIIKNTDYNIIFKAHPWERQKVNLKSSLTYNELMKYNIMHNFDNRVKLVEDFNIDSLFEQSDIITTICSQGALEATFSGKKVVQFGDAFYGNKGFTYDYSTIDNFIDDINNIEGKLSLEEYSNYQLFLLKVLQLHLVSVHSSGVSTLKSKFNDFKVLKISNNHNYNYKSDVVKDKYSGSKLQVFSQKLKKIPILGSSLLWFKHKILKWDI